MTTARRRRNSARALASAALLAIAAPSAAPATTVINATWLGATSGLWSDPTRWSTNPFFPNNDTPAPGTVYLATINAPSPTPYTVTLDTDASVGTLNLNGSGATFVQNANLTIGTVLSHTSGTYSLAGGTLFGNSPTSTPASVVGSITVPTLASPAIVGVNLNGSSSGNLATISLAPSSQLAITPPAGGSSNTYTIGNINLPTANGLPSMLVLLPPPGNGSGTPQVTGGSLFANINAALVTQSPDNLPVTFTGGNSNGALYLTPDTGSISLPNGLLSVNTVVKGGPNAIVGGSATPVGFKLTIEAGSVTSPTAPSGGTAIGSRPDIGSVGMLVTSSLRPANLSPTSTGILSFDPGSASGSTFPGAFTQAGQTYFSAAPNRTFYISADSFSPGSDNVYRFGGNGGWFQLASSSNSPLLTGSASLVVGVPRSLFGDEAAPNSTYITIKGPNSYTGPTTVNADAKLEVGNTVAGLTSPSNVTVDGTLVVPATLYYNYSGALSVRRGGHLEVDANIPGSHDNFPDTVPVHLAGATLTYAGTTTAPSETVGGVFADAGSVSINVDAPPPNTSANPLLTIQTLTRALGATVHFDSSYTHNLGQFAYTPRLFLGNSSSLLVNGIFPFATFPITSSTPQFLTYGANGVTVTSPSGGDINVASPTSNTALIATTTVLTADRTTNAVRTYPSSSPTTLDLRAHTLTLTSGCFIAAGTITVSNGALTSASPELFIHAMDLPGGDAPVTLSARITDSPNGPVSLVKDGTNTLVLSPPQPPGAVSSTYSGGTYVNEGALRSLAPLPTGPVYLSDATLDLRSNTAGTLMVPGILTASSSALGASTLHLADALTNATFGGGALRVTALTVSPGSTLLLTRSDNHSLTVDTVLDVRGAVLRASDGASLTLGGTGYYQDSAASALVNDPAAPAMPSFRFATGNQFTVNAVTRGVRLSAEPSTLNGAPTLLTYAGKLYSDNYDAELSATGNSRIFVGPSATLDTSRGFAGPSYDSHTLTLSGTGTVEFSPNFTLMQTTGSKTLNDVGSAVLRLAGGPVTFVTNATANLPNYSELPGTLRAGSITFDSPNATWQTRTSAQTYSQRLTLNAPANIDTQTDLTLTGPLTAAPASSLTKLGPGALTLPAAALTIPSVTVSAGRLSLPFSATLATDALTISSSNSASCTFAVGVAPVAADPASLDAVRQLLASARLTPATPSPNHALAYTLTPTSLSITLSLLGDANLDGVVNADDYALLDKNFALHTPSDHWTDGDFNYDGTVDASDYLAIDTTYLSTHPASPDFLARRQSQFGPSYVQELLTSVPEPASPLLLTAGYWLLATSPRRRRRRRRA